MITGECALLQLTGLKPKGYNPFVLLCDQLKREGVNINPKNRKECFNQLSFIYKDNNLTPHALLQKAIDSLTTKQPNNANL